MCGAPEPPRLAGDPDLLQGLWASELLHQNPGRRPAGHRQAAVRRPDPKDGQGRRAQCTGVAGAATEQAAAALRLVVMLSVSTGVSGSNPEQERWHRHARPRLPTARWVGHPVDFLTDSLSCWRCVQRGTPPLNRWFSVLSLTLSFLSLRPHSPAGEERGGSFWRRAPEICLRRRLHPEGRHVRRLRPHGGLPTTSQTLDANALCYVCVCCSFMFDEPSSYLDVKQRLKAAITIRSLITPDRWGKNEDLLLMRTPVAPSKS